MDNLLENIPSGTYELPTVNTDAYDENQNTAFEVTSRSAVCSPKVSTPKSIGLTKVTEMFNGNFNSCNNNVSKKSCAPCPSVRDIASKNFGVKKSTGLSGDKFKSCNNHNVANESRDLSLIKESGSLQSVEKCGFVCTSKSKIEATLLQSSNNIGLKQSENVSHPNLVKLQTIPCENLAYKVVTVPSQKVLRSPRMSLTAQYKDDNVKSTNSVAPQFETVDNPKEQVNVSQRPSDESSFGLGSAISRNRMKVLTPIASRPIYLAEVSDEVLPNSKPRVESPFPKVLKPSIIRKNEEAKLASSKQLDLDASNDSPQILGDFHLSFQKNLKKNGRPRKRNKKFLFNKTKGDRLKTIQLVVPDSITPLLYSDTIKSKSKAKLSFVGDKGVNTIVDMIGLEKYSKRSEVFDDQEISVAPSRKRRRLMTNKTKKSIESVKGNVKGLETTEPKKTFYDQLLHGPPPPSPDEEQENERRESAIHETWKEHEKRMSIVQRDIDEINAMVTTRKEFLKTSVMMGDKIKDKLDEKEAKKIVSEKVPILKSLSTGYVKSLRHDMYHGGLKTCFQLQSLAIHDPFLETQIKWVEDELNKVLLMLCDLRSKVTVEKYCTGNFLINNLNH